MGGCPPIVPMMPRVPMVPRVPMAAQAAGIEYEEDLGDIKDIYGGAN